MKAKLKADFIESKQDLRSALFDNASLGIVVVNAKGTVVDANKQAESLFGFKRGELIGQPLELLLPKRLMQIHTGYRDDFFSAPGYRSMGLGIELTGQRKDGTKFPVEARLNYVETNGEVLAVNFIVDITERKQVEQELTRTQERLNLALQPDVGLWDWDLRTNAVYFSPEWKRQLGFENHELADDSQESACRVHPEDRDKARAFVQAFLDNPVGTYKQEFRLRHKDGSYRWILSLGAVVLDAEGKPCRMVGTHLDITDRKLVEERLRERESRLTTIIDTAPGAVASFLMRPDGTSCFPFLSRRSKDIYGHDIRIAELEQDSAQIFDLIHPEDVLRVRDTIAESARTLRPWRAEFRVLNPDKGEVWVEGNFLPTREPDGSTLWHGIAVDITERKRSEEINRAYQEKLRMAIQATGIGLFEWEPDTGRARYSPEWKSLLGYGADEIEERFEEWEQRLHPADKRRVLTSLKSPLESHYAEFRMLHKDGSFHWYSGTVARDSGFPPGCVLGTLQDITARKESSEKLQALTGRLISAQEEEARNIARELHDSVGQDIAIINIKIRELEGLVSSQPAQALRNLRLLRRDVSSVATFIHDLSRRLHPSVLSQLGLAAALKSECANFARQYGIEAVFSQEGVPEMLADDIALCLYRIAQESLQNIRKHAHAKKLSVSLNVTGSEIVMSVRDFGEGFDKAALRGRGGLGLISMEERARLVHGSVSVNSKRGEGTHVEVRIPIPESKAA